jgi:hypothetical protein
MRRRYTLITLERRAPFADQVTLHLKADAPLSPEAAKRRHDGIRKLFLDGLAAGVPELEKFRSRAGQDKEMHATLARLELELKDIDVQTQVAKSDLSGETLAKRLVELERQRRETEARIPDIRRGIELFRADVERDTEAARKALQQMGKKVAVEAYQAARAEIAAAQTALCQAIGEHLDAVVDLLHATRPPVGDGACDELVEAAMRGELAANGKKPAGKGAKKPKGAQKQKGKTSPQATAVEPAEPAAPTKPVRPPRRKAAAPDDPADASEPMPAAPQPRAVASLETLDDDAQDRTDTATLRQNLEARKAAYVP